MSPQSKNKDVAQYGLMSQVLNPVVILGQVLHVQLFADPVCQKSPGNELFLALPKQNPACFGFF